MKNFDPTPPPFPPVCMQLDIVYCIITLFGFLLYCCHGNTNCLQGAKNLIFNSETVVKSAKCVALFLESIKMLQPKAWSRYNHTCEQAVYTDILVTKSVKISAGGLLFAKAINKQTPTFTGSPNSAGLRCTLNQ